MLFDGDISPVIGVSQAAPSNPMKTVACGCGRDKSCSRNNCSCRSASLSCTTYCNCEAIKEVCHDDNTQYPVYDKDYKADDDAL